MPCAFDVAEPGGAQLGQMLLHAPGKPVVVQEMPPWQEQIADRWIAREDLFAAAEIVQDNGGGFDTSFPLNGSNKTSSGINNMRKRAKLINAELNIESDIGKGTKITVTTPL